MKWRMALAGLALLAWASPAVSEGKQLSPSQMVRALQLVQDRVADGDHAALPIQRKLLEMIDQRLRTATEEEMVEPAQFRALLIYSMSGGNPTTLETLMSRMRLGEADARKCIGILSYLKGGTQAAASALEKIEPMQENPELGAFLALVKGSVLVQEKPADALKYLEQARLISPGTLVAEAALRRSMPLLIAAKDAKRFLIASDQYVRNFLRSPYASQFADALVAGVIELHETIDRDRLVAVVDQMSPEQQQVIYLRIARRSAIDGLKDLSEFASKRAEAAAAAARNLDDPRALLYATLARVATVPPEQLQADLKRIDRSRLSSGDIKLLDAVTTVGDEMLAPLPEVALPEPVAEKPVPAATAPVDPSIPEAQPETPEPAVAQEPAPAAETASDVPASAPPAPPASQAPAAATPPVAEAAPPAPPASEEAAAPPAPAPEEAAQAADAPPAPETASAEAPAAQAPATEPGAGAPATAGETSAPAGEAANAEAPPAQDPADVLVAEGRKKLGEIDELLSKATK